MSSNIRVNRVCANCGNDFVARTTVTRFCSHSCNRKFYKLELQAKKIALSEFDTVLHKQTNNAQKLDRELLSVGDVAILIGCSNEAVYKMVRLGKLKPANYLTRTIPKIKVGKEAYFSKEAISKLLKKQQKPKVHALERDREANQKIAQSGLKPFQCYTIDECTKMFGKDRSLLYGIFNRRLVPKIRQGHNVLISKKVVDKLYRAFKRDGKI